MKVLALIDLAPGRTLDDLRTGLAEELAASWALFAGGTLREAYATQEATRVVFVLEADDLREAEAQLRTLPLVGRGVFACELVELRPFVNWSRLFAALGGP